MKPFKEIETAATAVLPTEGAPPEPAVVGDVVDPRYVIEGEVGRGGLGRVVRARDERIGRTVAIKSLLISDPDLQRRFEREALITAQLEHPSIIPVYDIALDRETPFIAMKLVSGRTLHALIAGAHGLAERLALIPHAVAVADALAYAHSQHIVHRDVKAANVLVGAFGETVLIDWGLAKRLGEADDPAAPARAATAADLTSAGDVMGTPAFMAPEQAGGQPGDQRSDVYSLGALLYQLLTGVAPYHGTDGRRLFAELIAASPPPVEQRAPDTPRDLAAIVAKAMAHAPGDRYADAGELAADLKRFTTGQLVAARVYSRWALVGRWLRRYRLVLSVAAAALVALAVTGVLSVRRVVAERNRAAARANELRLAQARAALGSDPTAALAWLKTHQPTAASFGAARNIAADAVSQGVAHTVVATEAGPAQYLVVRRDGIVVTGHRDGVRLLRSGRPAESLAEDLVTALALGPDGLAVAFSTGIGRLEWLSADGTRRVLSGHDSVIPAIAFAPDGQSIAAVALDGTLRVWRAGDGQGRRLFAGPNELTRLAWSPDGTRLAAGGRDGVVHLIDPASGAAEPAAGHDGLITRLAFTADGSLISAGHDGAVVVRRPATPAATLRVDGYMIFDLAVSADGATAFSIGTDGGVWRWPLAGGAPRRLGGHSGTGGSIAISADGRWVASGASDGVIRLASTRTGTTYGLRGHRGIVHALAFAGDHLISTGGDGAVRTWPLPVDRAITLGGQGDVIVELAFGGDSRRLIATSNAGPVRLWDIAAASDRLLADEGLYPVIALSPDRATLATGGGRGAIDLVGLDGGAGASLQPAIGQVVAIAFSPDGRFLAAGGWLGLALGSAAGDDLVRLEGHHEGVIDVAFAPDGRLLASAGDDRTVRLWPVGGAPAPARAVLRGHAAYVFRLAWSPDGRRLASAADDRTVRLWTVATGDSEVLIHDATVMAIAFSPDGRTLAAGGHARDVVLWDVTRAPAARAKTLSGHDDTVFGLAFAPDGRHLATASRDATVRVWDLATGDARLLRGHVGAAKRVAFAPDGSALASGGEDGTVRVWPMSDEGLPPADAAGFRAWLDQQTSAEVGAGEQVATPISPR